MAHLLVGGRTWRGLGRPGHPDFQTITGLDRHPENIRTITSPVGSHAAWAIGLTALSALSDILSCGPNTEGVIWKCQEFSAQTRRFCYAAVTSTASTLSATVEVAIGEITAILAYTHRAETRRLAWSVSHTVFLARDIALTGS